MILGFTGTRNPISKHQIKYLWEFLDNNTDSIEGVHHGACMGGDAEMHEAALVRGIPLHVHPPVNEEWMERFCLIPGNGVTLYAPKPYQTRDRDIVAASDAMLAMPEKAEGIGGTWYTVDYAVRQRTPVTIVYSDGRVEER